MEETVCHHLCVYGGDKWDRTGEEFMTQPPSLVFVCDLPLTMALSQIPPLSLGSHVSPCTSLLFARK